MFKKMYEVLFERVCRGAFYTKLTKHLCETLHQWAEEKVAKKLGNAVQQCMRPIQDAHEKKNSTNHSMLAVPCEVRKEAQRVVEDGIGQMEGLKGLIEGMSRFVNVAQFYT
jgi:hypothetical protein